MDQRTALGIEKGWQLWAAAGVVVLHLIPGRPRPKVLGTGFFHREKGPLISAHHVLGVVPGPGERIVAALPDEDNPGASGLARVWDLRNVRKADGIDLAIADVPDAWELPHARWVPLAKEVALLDDVLVVDQASGDTGAGIRSYNWRGHVLTTYTGTEFGEPPPRIVEVSIPVVTGMSGAPILRVNTFEVLGMLFGNTNRQIHPAPPRNAGDEDRQWYLPIGQAFHVATIRAFLENQNVL